jgi:hypothetical protein
MASILWLIFGLAIIVIIIIVIIYLAVKKQEGRLDFSLYIGFIMGILSMTLIETYSSNQPKFAREYKLKTEIFQKSIDNKIVSIDTVYRFIKK